MHQTGGKDYSLVIIDKKEYNKQVHEKLKTEGYFDPLPDSIK